MCIVNYYGSITRGGVGELRVIHAPLFVQHPHPTPGPGWGWDPGCLPKPALRATWVGGVGMGGGGGGTVGLR